MKHVVFGTAGHIDHGKSALVQALTGTDPDRWEEEKRRGITIDLGFAHLDLDGARISLIDVPGHERFIHNMLAGAAGIDAVLLVVAANESVRPQTREHLDICRLLGIPRGLVVITKSDLASAETISVVRLELKSLLAGSFLEDAATVVVSARTGEGLDALKSEMARLAAETTAKPGASPFRLPIDRAFVIKGFGTVVTGTVVAGLIRDGGEAELFPAGTRVRVRGIQVHNQPAIEAAAGQRAALNLASVEVKDVHRGMMLAPPGHFRAVDRLDVSLLLLPTARPLKSRASIRFHCWSSETVAEVLFYDRKELHPGESAYAQLRLAGAGLFLPGDRFIIRQLSPAVTIGGGVVLDNLPPLANRSKHEAIHFLAALERSDDAARLKLLVSERGEAAIAELSARTGATRQEVERLAQRLPELRILGQPGVQLLHEDSAKLMESEILESLGRFHKANPLVPAMPKEELRGQLRLGQTAPSMLAFTALIGDLEAAGKIAARGDGVSLAGRSIQLDAAESAAKKQIEGAFALAGLCAPSVQEVLASLRIDRARAEKILYILLKEKVLIKISEGLIIHSSAIEELRGALARRKTSNPMLTVPDFKTLTGVSRKYAIPLLEYLDRERITRRSGNERAIL